MATQQDSNLQLVRNLATLKGIAVLPTAQRPTTLVEGPVGLQFNLPATLPNVRQISSAGQTYRVPVVIRSLNSEDDTALIVENAMSGPSGLVFAKTNRGTPSSYAGIIYGISADVIPIVGDGEAYWPNRIAQFWNAANVVIVTNSGKTKINIPLRECAVIAPNLALALSIDGNESPSAAEMIGATGSCLRSGDPIYRIAPAVPWTGQQSDDIQITWSGPAMTGMSGVFVYMRVWTIAGIVQTANAQNDDGGVPNLVPPGYCARGAVLTERQLVEMIASWRAFQAGRLPTDGGAQ